MSKWFLHQQKWVVGISPKHTPLITRLKPGDVRAQINKDQIETFFVSGGILEIQPNEVTILSDTALREEDLDEERALEAERAAKTMKQQAILIPTKPKQSYYKQRQT